MNFACHIASKLSRDAITIFLVDKSELGIDKKMKKIQKVPNSDHFSTTDTDLASRTDVRDSFFKCEYVKR